MDDISQALASASRLHEAGKLAEAERLYREILARQPNHPDALHLLGIVALQQGRPSEAVDLISRAVNIGPDNAFYLTHLGAAHAALQQWDQAADSFRRAIEADHNSAEAHFGLGIIHGNQRQPDRAAASFERVVAIEPARVEAHYNLGNAWRDQGRLDAAERCYREAIRRRPGYVNAVNNLGRVLRDQGRLDEAVETFRQAVALEPNYALGHYNLGIALGDLGHFDEAHACFSQAIAIDRNFADAYINLGGMLQAAGRFDEALACNEQALRIDAQLANAHFNRARIWLRRGDFERGWREFEWRWKCKTFSPFSGPQPRWDGSPLGGRTILLQAEQGLGDTLQFVRYAPLVHQRGARVILQCQPPLVPLLARCPGVASVVPLGAPLPEVDVYAPLMSLPGIFGTTLATIPVPAAYLSAEPGLVEHWRGELAATGGYRVGIAWQGNRRYLFDRLRSIPLDAFAALASVPNVRLISLQKHAGTEQLAAARERFPLVDLGVKLDEAAGPFMDTAAVIANLDLVIAPDTVMAHFAGALGVAVWVALPVASEWRWLTDRDDSPWYPTMRLFRQQNVGDWTVVFQRMAEVLAPLADR